jgi:antirestriction protein ArdC
VSGKFDRGINSFPLVAIKINPPYWRTLIAAERLGQFVRNGERGKLVIYRRVEIADEENW